MTPNQRFYLSDAWKRLRRQALIRDHFACTICGVNVSHRGQARVDHIQSLRTRPDLALTLANLRTLCTKHDNQAHREKMSGNGARDARFTGCDARGVPLDPNHHWHNGL
jgi:5-methylcytosine-specific restriction endonuclease McrA